MKGNNKKVIVILAVVAIVCFGAIYVGLTLTKNGGRSSSEVSTETAKNKLTKMVDKVDPTVIPPRKATVELGSTNLEDELPSINKYPLAVTGKGQINIEIFSSAEKAGKGNEGWLIEMAEEFNSKKIKIGKKTASVSIRSIASGLGSDYIISGKYLPDAFTFSNTLWADLILAKGGKVKLEEQQLLGNVAGILLEKKKHDILVEKYGSINMKTITEATVENEIAMGYTNPLTSSTGLNFLLSTLNAYDPSNPLSEKAVDGFEAFQVNVPFVAYVTMQMSDAVESGALDALILEYQTYVNNNDLRKYVFTPFGLRHDNPLYSVGKLSKEKQGALDKFLEYCMSDKAQERATKYGFNGLKDYKSEVKPFSGDQLLEAQSLWKEKKDAGRPVAAVFVADISGSMDGAPITGLKQSLINGAQYINKENSIGLVSYSSEVYMNLPINKFDLNQRALFTGAVEDMSANGGTATFDGVLVALDMLLKEKEANPDTKLMMFVLSDGETNNGYSLKDVEGLLKAFEIPIYTIGYNANIEALQAISQINEAASIDADSEDVIYKIKSLFNAQM